MAIIESARTQAGDPAGTEAVAAQVMASLSALPADEVIDAHQCLYELLACSYLSPLWAAAYVINGGCSDDSFEYFRGWLILQGRSVFEGALDNPDSLADLPAVCAAVMRQHSLQHEETLYTAAEAYEAATGHELPDHLVTADYPDLDSGWDFDFDDRAEMQRRLPRLVALRRPRA